MNDENPTLKPIIWQQGVSFIIPLAVMCGL
jgi:hypothetical protein